MHLKNKTYVLCVFTLYKCNIYIRQTTLYVRSPAISVSQLLSLSLPIDKTVLLNAEQLCAVVAVLPPRSLLCWFAVLFSLPGEECASNLDTYTFTICYSMTMWL